MDWLFDTSGFPRRFECGAGWSVVSGWWHVAAQVSIALAYFAIPVCLFAALRARARAGREIGPEVWGASRLAIAFIVACGVGHLADAAMFFWPAYNALGLSHTATAAVSWAMVLAMPSVASFVRDTPSPNKVAADLREASEPFERAFEESPHGMAIVSMDGRILRANDTLCGMLGYSRTELQSMNFQSLTTPDTIEGDLRLFEETKSGLRRGYTYPKAYIKRDGAVMPALLGTSLIRPTIDQREPYFVSQIVDRTAEAAALERLEAELAKGAKAFTESEARLAALRVAHEQLLERGWKDAADAVEEAIGEGGVDDQ